MTMCVRVSAEHAECIASIEAEAAAWPWTLASIRASLALPTTRAWLATVGGRACGHLLASTVAGEGEVLTIAVRPDDRRRGYAGRLLDACEASWRAEGVEQAFLEVRAGNTPAIALYTARGWRGVGRRRDYYPDGEEAMVMCWKAPC